jgi:hypothetical protein
VWPHAVAVALVEVVQLAGAGASQSAAESRRGVAGGMTGNWEIEKWRCFGVMGRRAFLSSEYMTPAYRLPLPRFALL